MAGKFAMAALDFKLIKNMMQVDWIYIPVNKSL